MSKDDVKSRFQFMSAVSNNFLEAANRASQFIPIDGKPGKFTMALWPTITCLAFSAEISLKAVIYMTTGQKLKGHDLHELWLKIPEPLGKFFIENSGLSQEIFLKKLISIKDTFIELRYPYELKADLNIDMNFLKSFSQSLNYFVKELN